MALYTTYRIIVCVLCVLMLWTLVKEKSLSRAISIGIFSIPFILRSLMIK
jgi:hypothetical protein